MWGGGSGGNVVGKNVTLCRTIARTARLLGTEETLLLLMQFNSERLTVLQ